MFPRGCCINTHAHHCRLVIFQLIAIFKSKVARLYLILRVTGAVGCVLAAISLGISVYALYYIVEKMTVEHSQYSSHVGKLNFILLSILTLEYSKVLKLITVNEELLSV